MQEFFVKPGQEVVVAKTISEADVYGFAGITGDFSSNHVNEQVMSRSRYGGRIAHGALLVGFMSTTSTRMIEMHGTSADGMATAVSLGYDRVRFLAPVFFGDTITVSYQIVDVDPARWRSHARISVVNQHGIKVAVAEHILKWVPNPVAAQDAVERVHPS